MKVIKRKSFIAESEAEAIRKAKEEFGSDVVILETKRFKKGGFLGLFAKKYVEVIVGVPEKRESDARVEFLAKLLSERKDSFTPTLTDRARRPLSNNDRIEALERDIKEVKELIGIFLERLERVEPLSRDEKRFGEGSRLYNFLLEQEIKEAYVGEILKAFLEKGASFKGLSWKELRKEIAKVVVDYIKVSPIKLKEGGTQVVAFVGPTGVGKTTTIAKLAAIFALFEEKKVALVTADTYRIAAVEQLKTYAKIIGIPIEVVFTPQEVRRAIEKHLDAEIILMDTAGRSHYDSMKMSELKSYIEASSPDEVHLVLSLNTKYKDLEEIVKRFSCVPINKMVLTKLDETSTFGNILNLVRDFSIPVSYVTNGQDVPKDIEVADPYKLSEVVLKLRGPKGEVVED
ncbi:MAG: flagellar biosynthesis protein FlhF [Synergistetes bacterium]|nr:MAG: Flagellar biosynthetic protein FlhF [bacterium 42_11]MBC7330999.1 flagellar biosynthesis protein FlhF [Synergistota bacterium]MDK2871610.1 flagellar biosynthesis protein FlhF [bacterium]